MPLTESTEAQLLAFAYGEMSAPEARAFEQRLQGDAELRAELASVMATRELFGQDARFGIDTKVDAPPPHLLDAIIRSEALARPPAIRDARAMAARPTLTARLSRWLIGGSVLVGATATILVVVTQRNDEAVLAPMATAAAPKEAPTEDALQPMGGADVPAEEADDPFAAKADARLEAKAVALPASPAPDAPSALPRVDNAKPKPSEPEDGAKGGRMRDLEDGDHGGFALGAAAGPGSGGGRADPGDATLLRKDAPATSTPALPRPVAESESTRSNRAPAKQERAKEARSGDDFGFDSAADGAGARGASTSSQAASPPPPPPASPAAEPAPTSVAPRRSAAPMTPPSEALALQERPSTSSLDTMTRDEMQAQRRGLVEVRREQAEKRKKVVSKSEAMDAPADKASAKSPEGKAKADDAKKAGEKAPLVQAGPEAKRGMQAEIALVSGYRELKEGRSLDALDEFQNAERLDARRVLGSDPHVGQMRALLALKRPAEALAIARRLVTRNVAEGGVVDGLLLGAKTAENIGDLRSARELWSALVKVPAHKTAATAALARIGNPAVRAATDAVDSAEAGETPAAAAPASKD